MIRLPGSLVVMAAASLLGTGGDADADEVRLRRQAVVGGSDVTLAEVAELKGEQAVALGSLVVGRFDGAEREPRITIAALRAALEEQEVNWAELSVKGFAVCAIRLREEETGETTDPVASPVSDADIPLASTAAANPVPPIDLHTPTTLRDRVLDWIETQTGSDRGGLRITWTSRDEPVLATRAVTDRYEFVPHGHGRLGRISLRINRYRGMELVDHYWVTPLVEKRVIAAVAIATIDRGVFIQADQIDLREVYLNRDGREVVVDPTILEGRVATTTLRPGTLIEARHLRVPLAARRGDQVTVRVFVQDLVVTMTARAMKDGVVGDTVELKNEHRDSRETFMARLVGRQQAVIDTTPSAGPGLFASSRPANARIPGGGSP